MGSKQTMTPDELREAVARAIMEAWANAEDNDFVSAAADAAIAVVLEEAARVAEHYEPRCDICPRGVAAAIRALIRTSS